MANIIPKIDPSKTIRPGCDECFAAKQCREFGHVHPNVIAHCAGVSFLSLEDQAAYRELWTCQRDGLPVPEKFGGSYYRCKIHTKQKASE